MLSKKPDTEATTIFFGLSVATVLTRLPFLTNATAGHDPDAWRIALSARHLATTGDYLASRFPSYPVHEIGSTLGWLLGGIGGLNVLTVLFSGIAAGFFGLVLRGLGVRPYALGALAFAFVPVVFVNSLFAMDYVWSVALALGGLYYTLEGRPVAAGVGLGLAIGARLTAGVLFLPLGWLLWRRGIAGEGGEGRAPLRTTALFAVATTAVAALCYLPPLFAYGPAFLRFYDGALPLRLAVHRATLEVWGEIGFAAVSAAVLWSLVRRRPVPAPLRPVELALLVGIGLYGIAYVRLPLEAGYLLPTVPLVLAWLGLRLPRRGFIALCLALIASPLFIDLEADSSLPREAMKPSLPIHVGSAEMRLLARGSLFTEQARVQHEADSLFAIVATLRTLPRPAIVLADGLWAKLDITLGEEGEGLVIVPSLDRLWEERGDDPLSRLWPPTDSMRQWPLYLLPGVRRPDDADPRLSGRRPVRIPHPDASSNRLSTSRASG